MSDQKGSILVTGANGGLGAAIVSHIANSSELAADYTGLYTVRNAATATQLQGALKGSRQTHQHEILNLDLSSVQSVRDSANDINSRVAKGELPPIRALILNAAFQEHTTLTKTNDGFDTTWQVNFLANFVLTLKLLQSWHNNPSVEDSRNNTGYSPYEAPWTDLFPGAGPLAKGQWSTPNDDSSWFSGFRRYGASKLCAVMLAQELAIRLGQDPELSNISVISLDPGSMPTMLVRRGGLFMRFVIMRVLLPLGAWFSRWSDPNGTVRPAWKSAADIMRACFEIPAPTRGELLYLNGTDVMETAKAVKEQEKRRDLWRVGVEAASIKGDDTILQSWQ